MQRIQKALFADLTSEGQIVKEELLPVPLPTIRNHFNSRFFPKRGEVNTLPSVTIPDDAISIQEMVDRYANGLSLAMRSDANYDGEEELTDLDRLDLAERQLVIEEAKERVKNAEEAHRRRLAAAEEARIDKIVQERIAAKAAQDKTDKPTPNE